MAAPPCFMCGALSRRACTKCGNFYCEEHGASFGSLCAQCDRKEGIAILVACIVIGLVFLVGLIIILARS
jgi:hypothetical protein